MTMVTPDPAAIEAERQRQMAASGGGGLPGLNGMTPQEFLATMSALAATPQGQAAIRAQQQTISMNVKQANQQIQESKAKIAIAQGTAAADKWYQQQQVAIANRAHELAVQTQNQNNAIAAGGLTGVYNGQPTLANLGQQAQYTGVYNGTPTLQAINQQQQFGLQQGQLTGNYQGNPTLQALENSQNFGINQAGVTGLYNGSPTLAAQNQQNQQQQSWANILGYAPNGNPTLAGLQNQQNYGINLAGVTGYAPNGDATLARQQAAANTSLQAGQLAASLQGPGNWAKFLQAQNGVAGSPASALVQSTPGGLGAAAGPNPPPLTLASVLGDWGVNPSSASASHGQQVYAGGQQGQQMYAGGSPSFNEQTGQYTPTQQQQQWAAQADPTTRQQPWWQQQNAGNPYVQQGGRSADVYSGGAPASYAEGGGGGGMGYDPMNPLGAIGQVANAPRVTNAQLGLSDDEAGTLQGYFNNPNSAPTGYWESKSPTEKSYLGGLNSYWGGDPATFESRYRNSRPNQGAWNAAA